MMKTKNLKYFLLKTKFKIDLDKIECKKHGFWSNNQNAIIITKVIYIFKIITNLLNYVIKPYLV